MPLISGPLMMLSSEEIPSSQRERQTDTVEVDGTLKGAGDRSKMWKMFVMFLEGGRPKRRKSRKMKGKWLYTEWVSVNLGLIFNLRCRILHRVNLGGRTGGGSVCIVIKAKWGWTYLHYFFLSVARSTPSVDGSVGSCWWTEMNNSVAWADGRFGWDDRDSA